MKTNRVLGILFLALLVVPAVGETFTYGADSFNATFAEGRERTILQGDAWVVSDTLRIESDEIELFGPDFRYVLCEGVVRAEDTEKGIVLDSNHLFFDREIELIQIRGPVEMIDLENEVVVRGGYLESREGNALTIIQVGVRIVRRDMITRSEYARYDRDADVLYLTGLPEVNRAGDIFAADEIVIDLETDEISLNGEVRGSLTLPEEDENATEN
jgi:lipopolysaccharide export system protein LptA